MDSWKGHNYYTRNATKQLELMNLSTAEWGIAWLPPNLVAIPYAKNDSIVAQYPENTTFIENVGKATTGDRATEKIVFGVTSGIVLFFVILWLLSGEFKLRDQPKRIRVSSVLSESEDGLQFMSFANFEKKLQKYYSPIRTEVELQDNVNMRRPTQGLRAEDVEAVTNLLKQMFHLDRGIWSRQHIHSGENHEILNRNARLRSNAIWDEVKRTVRGWQDGLYDRTVQLSDAQTEHIEHIFNLLGRDQIGGSRYRV